MTNHEPNPTSFELSDTSDILYPDGWKELLEAPDAIDYQLWLHDLIGLTQRQIPELALDDITTLRAWLKALEQVADVAIDPEEMENMTQAEIAETTLITLQTNIESIGWDEEGVVFTVPNMFTEEEATINLRELLRLNQPDS